MKLYIYPNGEVHDVPQDDMSDDHFVISENMTLGKVTVLITAHFGVRPQAYQVWQDVLYYIGEQPYIAIRRMK